MKITVRQNGVHSIAEALRAFKKFHDDNTDIYALKDCIIRSHHGIETLFKDLLYRENFVLLLTGEHKVEQILKELVRFKKNEISSPIDNLRSVTIEETLKRLKELGFLKDVDEKDIGLLYESVGQLSKYRNRLQHYSLEANPEVISRILGSSIPRAIGILQNFSSSLIVELNMIYSSSSNIIELLRKNYDTLIREAIAFFKTQEFKQQTLKLSVGSIDEYSLDGFIHIDGIPQTVKTGENEPDLIYKNRLTGKSKITDESYTHYQNNFWGELKGRLEFRGEFTIQNEIGTYFTLPESQEKIAIMKNMLVNFELLFNFHAEGYKTSAHYVINRVINGKGEWNLNVTLMPKGFESKENEIIGKYNVNLDEQNTHFRYHDFVGPDGSLVGHNTLDLKLTTCGDLSFS